MITFEDLKNPRKIKETYVPYTITYQNQVLSLCELSKQLPKENHNNEFIRIVNEQLKPEVEKQVLVSYDDGQMFTLKVLETAEMLLLKELLANGNEKVNILSEYFYVCEYTGEQSFMDVIHQLFMKQLFAKVNYDLPLSEADMQHDSELFPNS